MAQRHGCDKKLNQLECFREVVSESQVSDICWTLVLVFVVRKLVAVEVLLGLNHLLLEK